jgi:AP-3 complex subunit delta
LCPHEPRLAKKLVDPLTTIINTTPAKSLLYECLFTVTKGMHDQKGIVRLAVEKLKEMVVHPDQNCKTILN